MHRTRIAVPLVLTGVLTFGCATSSESKALPSYTETRTEKATATVEAVNQTTREVKLKAEDGETFEFVAGPQVRNLAQVQVGDQVVVEYTESIALEVKRADGTQPNIVVAEGADRSAAGEKPAAGVGRQVNVSAVIVAVDKPNLRVTVKGPAGNMRVLQAKDPKKLENVQVGDMVYVTYTEGMAISLEKKQ